MAIAFYCNLTTDNTNNLRYLLVSADFITQAANCCSLPVTIIFVAALSQIYTRLLGQSVNSSFVTGNWCDHNVTGQRDHQNINCHSYCTEYDAYMQ